MNRKNTVFILSGMLLLAPLAFAGTTLPNTLYKNHASGLSRASGDYVINASTGLDAPYNWYIEVPQGLPNLTVEVFDSDFGLGSATDEGSTGNPGNRDRFVGTGYNSSVVYSLFSPDGTLVASITRDATTGVDNGWETIASIANPTNGHWQLTIDSTSSVTTGDDTNGYGIRAHDGNPGAGGVELNVYAETYVMVGPNDIPGDFVQVYPQYAYITSGCNCYIRDFDTDDDSANVTTTLDVQSRNGFFNPPPLNLDSNNDVWSTESFVGFADDGGFSVGGTSDGYGIWPMTIAVDGHETSSANYIVLYAAAFDSPGAPFLGGDFNFPPNSQPEESAFRMYLPRDGSTLASPVAPALPYVRQYIHDVVSGPNPPQILQNTFLKIRVEVVNPGAQPITFSPINTVTVNVPTLRVQYVRPSAILSQGTILSQPANAGTGNIVWNPGVVNPGQTARLEYRIRVRPTLVTQTTAITGTPSTNGTVARFVDGTGNAAEARSTYTFGPICQLSIESDFIDLLGLGGTTLSVDLLDFSGELQDNGTVKLNWETAEEVDNAGFELVEAAVSGNVNLEGDLLTISPIPAIGSQGGTYEWVDARPLELNKERGYYLVDIDLSGKRSYHGPIYVNNFKTSFSSSVENWQLFH